MATRLLCAATVLALALAPELGRAQVSPGPDPYSEYLTVTYSGTVANPVNDTIMIRQPDGTSAPYTGPLPAWDYQKGQQVTISYTAIVPNAAYFSSPRYTGQQAADGVYQISLSASPNNNANGFGPVAPVKGTIGGSTFYPAQGSGGGAPGMSQTLIYNANTDQYMIAGSGGFREVVNPSFPRAVYDGTTGAITGTCTTAACQQAFVNGFTVDNFLHGDTAGPNPTININGQVPIIDNATGAIVGYFQAFLNGVWSLPQFGGGSGGGGSGGGTAVPEPSMLALFGASSGLLAIRRRRRRALA